MRAGPQGARRFARCFYGSTNLKSAHQVRLSIVGGSNFRPRSKTLPGLITTDSAMPRASPSLSVPVPWPPTRFPRRSTVPFQSVPFARFQLPSPSTITASSPSPCTIRNRTFAAFTARSCGLNGPFTGTGPCLGSGISRSNRPMLIFHLQSTRVSSRAHPLQAHPCPFGPDELPLALEQLQPRPERRLGLCGTAVELEHLCQVEEGFAVVGQEIGLRSEVHRLAGEPLRLVSAPLLRKELGVR